MRRLLAGLLFVTATACEPLVVVGFTPIVTPAAVIEANSRAITIPIGVAIALRSRMLVDGELRDDRPEVSFSSSNPEIVQILSSGEEQSFVVWGVRQGTTTITGRVVARNALGGISYQVAPTINVTVTPPTP